MHYVFWGTPEFAAVTLERLMRGGCAPRAVVCNPDRPVGRKQTLTAPPVKQLIVRQASGATGQKIEMLQPEKLDPSFMLHISGFKPDFFIVAAYAKIIPATILSIPRLGTIGVHPSLLPKYRGATPIQNALLAGEATTGVTLYLMDEKVDHGPVVARCEAHIAKNETYETLLKKLAESAGELLAETLPKFVSGEIKPQVQDESRATFTKKLTTEDGFVDEKYLKAAFAGDTEKAIMIDRKIRALNPEPGAWTQLSSLTLGNRTIANKRVKLLEATVENGSLRLEKIHVEGKNPETIG